jgi:hypothetical protein
VPLRRCVRSHGPVRSSLDASSRGGKRPSVVGAWSATTGEAMEDTMTEQRSLTTRARVERPTGLAATAIAAARVYDALGWLRWSGHDAYNDRDFHVPGVDELLRVLTDLAARARAAAADGAAEVDRRVGYLRFLASADDDGVVTFHLSIGSTFPDDGSASPTGAR